jgi:hypothetical protein
MLKSPGASLDYGVRWLPWLESGDTIVSSSWTIPIGLSKESESFTDSDTVIWLSGGVDDTDYVVTNNIVTSDGRKDERTIILKVRKNR